MSTEREEIPGEEEERDWRDRFTAIAEAVRSLAATRLAILREELSLKAVLASKGLLAIAIAFALGVGVLLLGAALLVAVFAGLLKSVALGILATLILYGAATAVLVRIGWGALSQVEPLEFSATRDELARDWQAVRSALSSEEEPEGGIPPGEGEDAEAIDDLEERYRAGAE